MTPPHQNAVTPMDFTNTPIPVEDTIEIRDQIINHCSMTEILGEDSGPFKRLILSRGPKIEAGYLRLWESPEGSVVDRLFHIYVGGNGNDVNLMYAMTRADSPVPHFFLHYNVNPGDVWSYHIDLPMKVDGVMYQDYWQEAMSPLSKITESKKIKSIPTRRIQSDRKQYLSTWGFYGKEVPEQEYRLMRDDVFPKFTSRFLELVDGFSYDGVDKSYLIERGRKQQDILFDREMDLKGWGRLEALFGRDVGDELRAICRKELKPI